VEGVSRTAYVLTDVPDIITNNLDFSCMKLTFYFWILRSEYKQPLDYNLWRHIKSLFSETKSLTLRRANRPHRGTRSADRKWRRQRK